MSRSLISKTQLSPDIESLIYQYGSKYFLGIDPTSTVIVTTGDNLIERYNFVKTLTPGGAPLSSTNRAFLLILPGIYSLATELSIDTQFVDLIGLGSLRLERGSKPSVIITGNTLNVIANDVRISGISVDTQEFKIGNNLSLQIFENCVGGNNSFRGSSTTGGIASGTFINCIGGNNSFGGGGVTGGTASGTFVNCTGGNNSFGGGATTGGTASGTFVNCTGSMDCFGGGSVTGGAPLGVFTNCIGGADSFGGATGANMSNGRFYICRLTSGTFRIVTGNGIMRNCIDGNNNLINQ